MDTCRHVDVAVCCDGMSVERLRPGGHIHASVTVLVRGDGLFFKKKNSYMPRALHDGLHFKSYTVLFVLFI